MVSFSEIKERSVELAQSAKSRSVTKETYSTNDKSSRKRVTGWFIYNTYEQKCYGKKDSPDYRETLDQWFLIVDISGKLFVYTSKAVFYRAPGQEKRNSRVQSVRLLRGSDLKGDCSPKKIAEYLDKFEERYL